jgi:hypothetical protein
MSVNFYIEVISPSTQGTVKPFVSVIFLLLFKYSLLIRGTSYNHDKNTVSFID